MIAAWMLWATGLGVLLYAAAWAIDHASTTVKWPTRSVWALALLVAIVVPGWLAARRAPALPTHVTSTVMLSPAVLVAGSQATIPEPPRAYSIHAWNRPLLAVWALASGLLLLRFLVGARRLARRRRTWMPSSLDGQAVVIAEADGPALTGIIHPIIVVPRWLADSPPADRALVLRHEHEHRRARDPLLLAFGSLALVMMPWNAALWILRRRLRLAVEVDCDARVLASGADPGSYGSLLLTVAERMSPATNLSPALLEPASFLEGRIRAMTPTPRRHPVLNAAVSCSLAALSVAAACRAPQPSPLRPSVPLVVAPAAPPRLAAQRMQMQVKQAVAARTDLRELREGDTAYVWILLSPSGKVVRSGRSPSEEALHIEGQGSMTLTYSGDSELPIRGIVVVTALWQDDYRPALADSVGIFTERMLATIRRLNPEMFREASAEHPIWVLTDSTGEVLLQTRFGSVPLPPHDSTIAAGFGIPVTGLLTWNYAEIRRPDLEVKMVLARSRN